jgi:hypothetical protein
VPATVLTLLVFEMASEGAIDMAESDLITHSQRLNLFDLSQPYFDFANSCWSVKAFIPLLCDMPYGMLPSSQSWARRLRKGTPFAASDSVSIARANGQSRRDGRIKREHTERGLHDLNTHCPGRDFELSSYWPL